MTNEEPWSSCLVLLHVVPPLLFTVTTFPATPTNNLAVPSPSLGVCHCNKRDMWNSRELLSEKELQSGHYTAYSRAAGTCYPTGCTCFHYKRFENCWKHFAEQLLVLHTVIPHHALVERSKDKTVRNAKSLKQSIGTVIVNVPNCILRSRIIYIYTTGFLFVVW